MENLQPDAAITASSFYSKVTLPTSSITSNSSTDTFETLSSEEGDKKDLVINGNAIGTINISQSTLESQPPKVPEKTAEDNIPSVTTTNASSGLTKKKSILQRSLSLLTRSEEKKAKTQSFKVHKFTIYDDEKDEFIEVVEEEWEGDGPPPPKKSIDYQRKGALIIDKALPNLPELSPDEIKKENPITKFNKWLKDRHPYVNRYKLPIIISLILIFIILLIIIILAATGAFVKSENKNDFNSNNGGKNNGGNKGQNPKDPGRPGLQMNGTGFGTYYDPGVGIGACGLQNTANQFVCAMNSQQFGDYPNPNNAAICGMCVKITGPKGTVKAKIVDKCPTCGFGDIDMSPAAFNVIGDEFQGRIPISWEGC